MTDNATYCGARTSRKYDNFCSLGCDVCLLLVLLEIFQIVKFHQSQIHAQIQISRSLSKPGTFPNIAGYKKSVLTMLYLYGFFVLCYFPCSVVAITGYMVDGLIYYWLADISLTVTFLNSSLNPFLFFWRIRVTPGCKKYYYKVEKPNG